MVTKTSKTYKFSETTLSLIERLKALPEYSGKATRLLEMLVLEKARELGLEPDNGNVGKRKKGNQ